MRRLTTLFSLAILALLLAAACNGATSTPTPVPKGLLDWVPADASLLLSVQLQKALEDTDIHDGFAQLAGAFEADDTTLDEALLKAELIIGINLKTIEEALLFFEGNFLTDRLGSEDLPGALLVKGSYDRAKLLAALEREQGPLKTTTYKGEELLVDEDEEGAVAFLEQDVFALGTVPGVQAVIDVRTEERPALSGAFLEAFKAMGSPLAKFSMKLPGGYLEDALGGGDAALGDAPIDLSLFTQIRSLGMSIDKLQKDLAVALTLDYPDEASAQLGSDGLGGLVAFFKAFSGNPELNAFLDKVQIGSTGSQLTIAVHLSAQEIEDGINVLGGVGFGGASETGVVPPQILELERVPPHTHTPTPTS